MEEKEAREWASNPEWKPMPVKETREEYDERLKDKEPKMRDHHWGYYKWVEAMSLLTPEERFESWKDFQEDKL